MKECGGVEVQRFVLAEIACGTLWIGSWVDPRAGHDAVD
jgi:hypothetical protein